MMSLAATQVSVIFSLNIVVRDDRRGLSFIPVPIFAMTSFFFLLWRVWHTVQVARLEIKVLGVSLVQAIDVICKVLSIGFSAVKFGLMGV